MGFKQHISRTWQMIEQQVNDVPFRPHNEAPHRVKPSRKRLFHSVCGILLIQNNVRNLGLRQIYDKYFFEQLQNLTTNACRKLNFYCKTKDFLIEYNKALIHKTVLLKMIFGGTVCSIK